MADKISIVKHFGKLFAHKPESDDEAVIALEERKLYLDLANVAGIVPKKEWVKQAIWTLFDVSEPGKVPELNYSNDSLKGLSSSCKYSGEYLKILIAIVAEYDSVKISVQHDYPMKIETDDFIMILAPRVEND